MVSKAPAIKSRSKSPLVDRKNNWSEDIEVATISSSTAIHVTRAQIVGTILVSLVTLVGVAMANLDKLTRRAPTQTINRLQIENNIATAREFLEENRKDALNARRELSQRPNSSAIVKANQGLDTYIADHEGRQDRFNKVMDQLSGGLNTGNLEVVENSRKALDIITIEDAASLTDSINQLPPPMTRPVSDSSAKDERESAVETLRRRKPALELTRTLPINQDRSAVFSSMTNADVRTHLSGNTETQTTSNFDLGVQYNYMDKTYSRTSVPRVDLGRNSYSNLGRSETGILFNDQILSNFMPSSPALGQSASSSNRNADVHTQLSGSSDLQTTSNFGLGVQYNYVDKRYSGTSVPGADLGRKLYSNERRRETGIFFEDQTSSNFLTSSPPAGPSADENYFLGDRGNLRANDVTVKPGISKSTKEFYSNPTAMRLLAVPFLISGTVQVDPNKSGNKLEFGERVIVSSEPVPPCPPGKGYLRTKFEF
jgi:hypothetical protein